MADWNLNENSLIVEDYFAMLSRELRGQHFNKTGHRRELLPRLNDRSHGSVERKHQNISAILLEIGFPFINGYKPLRNYQRDILPDLVFDFLVKHPEIEKLVADDVQTEPTVPEVDDILRAWVDAPARELSQSGICEPETSYSRGKNYLAQESVNRELGTAGEQFVVHFERARLLHAGKSKLADQVEHVAATQGDGLGFDVMSFECNGRERPIEVKTTRYGKYTPFFVTPNELRFSERAASNYYLYRIFNFRTLPRFFACNGPLKSHVHLEPSEFIARIV